MMVKRSEHWPYGEIEANMSMTFKGKRSLKATVAIMVTVLLSLWLGLMFARGL